MLHTTSYANMLFSVIIPTYNRRQTIGAAIASALEQDVLECEVIVVDDGSTDDTLAWLASEFADARLSVATNQRAKGPAGARNTGLLAARGEFIALLDSDDCFLPGHLVASARVFQRFAEVDVIFGRAVYEQDGKVVEYMGPNFERKLTAAPATHADDEVTVFSAGYFAHLLRYGCYFNLSTVVLRAAAVRGQLMNEYLRVAEDYEFWVRLSRMHQFACLRRPQIRYALHEGNISFEADDSAAQHAPSQLAAFEIMLDYPGLEPGHRGQIRANMAEVLFNWGYRCRKHQLLRDSMRLHLRSLRYGLRRENLVALLKLGVAGLFPGLAASDR